jgi:hypothetical protein
LENAWTEEKELKLRFQTWIVPDEHDVVASRSFAAAFPFSIFRQAIMT